jgi:hypothetical protein
MPGLLPPPPVNPTGQLAQYMPGYDPEPVIAAQEQSLQDYLNLPVKEILSRLGLPALDTQRPEEGEKEGDPRQEEQPPEEAPPPASPMDPSSLISPVTDALGTLGSGLFEGMDPTQMLAGISNAFGSTSPQLQQSLGSVDDSWQGASGTEAATKTATAIANGSEVAAQSDALRSSLATAAADVAQARARLIAIITEFQATLAAIGPSIIFPWGWAAAIAAATKAITSAAEVMTELQGSLGTKAAQVSAAGTPVDVTAAPQLGSSPIASLVSPLMSMATKGAQAGIQAGTGAASAANQAAEQNPPAPAVGIAAAGAGPRGGGGGGGVGGGGAGGGGSAALAARSLASAPMVQPETAAPQAQSTVRASAGGSAGAGMMGAPYAPMAGHGANSTSNSHTPAAFLHTTDQGGEIVGDLGTAAPPVLGEADPNEPPDVELRI